MSALLIISGAALVFSMVVHFGTLLNIVNFSNELQTGLKGLFFVLLILSYFISEKTRRLIGKDNFAKGLKESIPEWMKSAMGLITLYGVGMFLFFIGSAASAASDTQNKEVTVDKFNNGLTALIMAAYALLFFSFILYKRTEDKYLKRT